MSSRNDREVAPRFAAIGGHHSRSAGSVEWLTPPSLIQALGGWESIDRDPCAPVIQMYRTARGVWTMLDDGLAQDWDPRERFYVNPPYGDEVAVWLSRLADQGNGTALIFARTETDAFFEQGWLRAHAALFLRGRLNFHYGEALSMISYRGGKVVRGRTFEAGERAPKNSGAPSVLLAYGEEEAERLAESGIEGQFVPLILRRSVVVSLVHGVDAITWRQLVVEILKEADGPVHVATVWRVVRTHPKAAGREHARAKVRQILQAVGERVDRGQYRLAV